ncbi:MAG: hypothetical protein ABH877_00825 [bacterium]
MPGRGEEPELHDLEERLLQAFEEAYPEVEKGERSHMARNFIQVMQGIIDFGERLGLEGEVTHMDIANGLVYWCFANTSLEDISSGKDSGGGPATGAHITEREMQELISECQARVADWLIGLEVLRDEPELYRKFVKGAVALGAVGWERDRGKLKY